MPRLRPVVAAFLVVPLLAACAGGGTAADEADGDRTANSESSSSATPSADASTGTDGETAPADDRNSADRAPGKLACGVNSWDDGSLAEKYCGDGSVRISIDGTAIDVDGATCEDRGLFTLTNFGTAYSDEEDAQGDYLGLVLENADEGPRISALELTRAGKRMEVKKATVKVRTTKKRLDADVVGSLKDGRDLKLTVSCALT